ncbi:MAG: molybdenum transporter ATP-binding protein [Sphingomonas bacterium]|nr:ATP-binding cassette domain-containing protein [Sphingomonas bacterium]MDB5690335.1 molybdenum transporter ATP-binding protein [Sphingomonas bacterium]
MSSEASFDIDVQRAIGRARVALRFAVGEGLTVLFGPSGAGKTSVLNMVAGLIRPERGHVRVGGRTLFDHAAGIDVPPERRRIGYVFQDGRLFPHRRVRANLLYGHRLAPPEDRWMGLEEATDFLGIGHLLDRWPGSLSGGEARRVAIGRALLSGPAALLMDEPLSSLDQPRRDEIMGVIERIRNELRLPILYVTHDAGEADRLATQRVPIEPGG